jgi:catechol 2,3-dioxygenase-like lactoylglutathione lyase family enzyme
MAVEKLSFVLPVDDLAVAVAFWKDLLGMDPTFVDGDRWAQFDHGGARLALAGKDRASDSPGVMLKVRGLGAVCDALRGAGSSVSEITTGAHERRAVATEPAGSPVVLYEPLPS